MKLNLLHYRYTLFTIILTLRSVQCRNVPFARYDVTLFGIKRGGGSNHDTRLVIDDDYERAEQAILNSIAKVETMVEKVVTNEVNTLFHNTDQAGKDEIVSKAKKGVTDGVRTVKNTVKGHTDRSRYPYETSSNEKPIHKDHRILRAIEAAEHAVLHAIENEVDVLFHETIDHHDPPKKSKSIVKDGVKKAATNIQQVHDHRRDWLQSVSAALIEDYSIPEFFLE